MAEAGPEKIVYVSCDVATQARDAALLCAQGRIPGTVKAGKTWLLSPDAQKPLDPRLGKAATDKL